MRDLIHCLLCLNDVKHAWQSARFPKQPKAFVAKVVESMEHVLARTVLPQAQLPKLERPEVSFHCGANLAPFLTARGAPNCAIHSFRRDVGHSVTFLAHLGAPPFSVAMLALDHQSHNLPPLPLGDGPCALDALARGGLCRRIARFTTSYPII
jgi:hypothetical protein